MTVGYEPYLGARFIRMKLLQNAALTALVSQRVYRDVAPPEADYPYVVMTLLNANDLEVIGGIRVWADLLWQVEFWSRTNDDGVIAAGAAEIDAALHDTSGSMTGSTYGSGNVWAVVRERPIVLPPEIEGGVIWRRGGGEYRQLVQAL